MKLFRQLVALLALVAMLPLAAQAQTSKLKNNLQVTGNLTVDGTSTLTGAITQTGNVTVGGNLSVTGNTTHTGTLTQTGAATFTVAPVLSSGTFSANGDTITIQDLGNANLIQSEGTQTINGTKTFGTPLVKANVNASVKRQALTWYVNPIATAVIADGATYKGFLPIGRAATVTKVNCLCGTAPVGGTSTIKVLKASGSGNTMLSTATVDPTTLVDNTISSLTLTGTGADLAVTAAQGVYLEWVSGTQTTDGVNCAINVEYELDDI